MRYSLGLASAFAAIVLLTIDAHAASVGGATASVMPAPGPTTAPTTAPARLPIPSADAQAAALKTIRGLFQKRYADTTPAGRRALAQLLLDQGRATHDLPAARYVCFSEAMELACDAGSLDGALAALDAQMHDYAGDALVRRAALLKKAEPHADTPAAAEALAAAWLDLLETAAHAERFDVSDPNVAAATAAVQRVKNVAFNIRAQRRIANYRWLKGLRDAARALGTPRDSAGHRAVGEYHAFVRDDWAAAVPELAGGPPGLLHDAAARELRGAADPLEQVRLADAWWAAGDDASLPDGVRLGCRAHARTWYARAQTGISGITLTRIRQRLFAADDPPPAAAARGADAALAAGPAIDLLTPVDVSKCGVSGTWTRRGAALACDRGSAARLELPYGPPESYDLDVAFTREEGSGPVVLLLARGDGAFGVELDARGHVARLELVDKKISKDNPTVTPLTLTTGQRYHAVVQVRPNVVTVLLDDKPVLTWKTDYSDLTRYRAWKLHDDAHLGLGASSAAVTFHKVTVIERSGRGQMAR